MFLVGPPASSGTVTLNGSGFGVKSSATPLYFSTFESFNVGDATTAVGLEALNDATPSVQPTVTTNRAHSGTKSFMKIYPLNSGSQFPGTGKSISAASNVLSLYVGQWVYWEWSSGTLQSSFIFKWSRGGCGVIYHGTPQFYNTQRPRSDGGIDNPGGDSGFVNANGTTFDDSIPHGPSRDTWHWMEYKYQLSTSGVSDGKYQWLCDGVVDANLVNGMTRTSTDTTTATWVMCVMDGCDSYGVNNEYRLYVDELLIDTTLARVVATDNQTYASSTNWAPQKPSSWSDTQITIGSPNYGTLTRGTTAYFHVFDGTDSHITAIAQAVP